jgi:hypothetical protein
MSDKSRQKKEMRWPERVPLSAPIFFLLTPSPHRLYPEIAGRGIIMITLSDPLTIILYIFNHPSNDDDKRSGKKKKKAKRKISDAATHPWPMAALESEGKKQTVFRRRTSYAGSR